MKNYRVKFIFIFLILLLGGPIYGAQANLEQELSFQVTTPEYTITVDEDGYHKVSLPGYKSYAVPGYPDLPAKLLRFSVPPTAIESTIRVEYTEEDSVILGTFSIDSLPAMTTRVNFTESLDTTPEIYYQDAFYPEQTVEYHGLSRMRKWQIVSLKYSPFQYNPISQELKFISQASIRIVYEQADTRASAEPAFVDTTMDKRAGKLLENSRQSAEWYPAEVPVLRQTSETYNYAIITTNATRDDSIKLVDFQDYLISKGFSPILVTEDDYGVLTGQAPDGTAEKIRQWLIDNYQEMGIEYVLLIGNPDPDDPSDDHDTVGDVPMKMCWPRNNEPSYTNCYNSPTDYFYADLTGNWDLDGDCYFGEYGTSYGAPDCDRGYGGVDLLNEVYVGRIPVYADGITKLDSILDKIIAYGNAVSIDWRDNILLPMSFSDTSTDGAYLAEEMVNNYLTHNGMIDYKMYMHDEICEAGNSKFSSDEELLDGATKNRWMNNPYGMVWWWGHGTQSDAYIGYGGGSSGKIVSSSDAADLDDNHPSFVYQCSCLNGYPENSYNLGATLLNNGAIATVSASRTSWYLVTSWNTKLKYFCDNASIGYYYGEELVANGKPAGVALYDAKSDMGTGSNLGSTSWMNLFSFNLYGDPALSLFESFRGTPPPVTTTSADEVTTNSANINGTVNPNGLETTYYFEYGETIVYGSESLHVSSGSGDSTVSVTSTLLNLTPNTHHHYRLVASNATGTNYGNDVTFSTAAPCDCPDGYQLYTRPDSRIPRFIDGNTSTE